MKKIFLILAVMALIGIAAGSFIPVPSYGVIMQSPDARVKTSVWTGTTADGATPTAGSALTAGNRIVGWSIIGSSSPVAGLYDNAAGPGALTEAMLFDEPAAASNVPHLVFYPAPKTLTNGLQVVRNGKTAAITLIVFYE